MQPDSVQAGSSGGHCQGSERVPGVAELADVGDEDVAAVDPELRSLVSLYFGALAHAGEDGGGGAGERNGTPRLG